MIGHHLCPLDYVSNDDAINLIMSTSGSVYLTKLDIKSTFWQGDHSLFDIYWQRNYYYQHVLQSSAHSRTSIIIKKIDSVATAING